MLWLYILLGIVLFFAIILAIPIKLLVALKTIKKSEQKKTKKALHYRALRVKEKLLAALKIIKGQNNKRTNEDKFKTKLKEKMRKTRSKLINSNYASRRNAKAFTKVAWQLLRPLWFPRFADGFTRRPLTTIVRIIIKDKKTDRIRLFG